MYTYVYLWGYCGVGPEPPHPTPLCRTPPYTYVYIYVCMYVCIDFLLVALIPRLVDLVVYWLRSLVEPNSFFEHLLDRFFECTRVYSSSLRFSMIFDDSRLLLSDLG